MKKILGMALLIPFAAGWLTARPALAQDNPPERRGPREDVRPPEPGGPGGAGGAGGPGGGEWTGDDRDGQRETREAREREAREREGRERRPGPGSGQPGGRQGRPGQPGAPGFPTLGPEDTARVEAFLKEFDPGRLEKLQAIRRQNPEVFENALRDAFMEMKRLEQLKQEDPERFERVMSQRRLEAKSMDLAARIKRAPEGDKVVLKKELKELLSQVFDLREAEREAEVKELERQVAKLRERIAKRKESRDKIIQGRAAELLGEREDLDW
ncbi:MAG: hypothetical protein HYZ53_06850 [Planctomycetes bacterium]|nr:hypothetical protein [Planctomycetota bacterium]